MSPWFCPEELEEWSCYHQRKRNCRRKRLQQEDQGFRVNTIVSLLLTTLSQGPQFTKIICNMAVDVLNFSSPTSFGPLSGFHSSAHLCLGATSQFSTTHVSMLLTDRDVRIVFGRQSFRVSSAVSLPVMACAPANVCKTAS